MRAEPQRRWGGCAAQEITTGFLPTPLADERLLQRGVADRKWEQLAAEAGCCWRRGRSAAWSAGGWRQLERSGPLMANRYGPTESDDVRVCAWME